MTTSDAGGNDVLVALVSMGSNRCVKCLLVYLGVYGAFVCACACMYLFVSMVCDRVYVRHLGVDGKQQVLAHACVRGEGKGGCMGMCVNVC